MEQFQPVTLFDAPTIIQDMTRTEAERCEAEIISTGSHLRALLVEFYERRGWMALGYGSWRGWAVATLGEHQATAYRELAAGVIEQHISPMGEIGAIPERHLRPLAPLKDDPDILRDTWDRAHEMADERGERFAARHVEAAVEEYRAGAPLPDSDPAPVSRFNEGMRSSDSAEWYTPMHIIERTRRLLVRIELDPASCATANRSVGADTWFGLDHPDSRNRDGLAREWPGRVWMNPPYGDVIGEWVHRLIHQYDHEITLEAVALLPARTDTAWFKPLRRRFAICFLDGRLKFSNAENSAPFPSVVVFFGEPSRWDDFAMTFGDVGDVMVPHDLTK